VARPSWPGGPAPPPYQADQLFYTIDPNHDLALHVPLAIGFVANSRFTNYTFSGGPPGGIDYGTEVEARIRLSTMVVPTGPNPPTWSYYARYSRWEHCPGL
jgi:hypothetical protein